MNISQRSAIFLLSPARSFSTVSLALLAGHPSLFGFPEMLVFSTPDVRGFLEEGTRNPEHGAIWTHNRLTGVLRCIAQVHEGSQSPEAIANAEQWLRARQDWSMVGLLDHLLGLVEPLIGVEKSPDTASTPGALNACVAAFPRARFIHLTRHPVTNQRSMHEFYRQTEKQQRSNLAASCAYQWYLAHLRITQALAALPADRWMRVRGEDLLSEPRVWLPRICAWLGLEHDPSVVEMMLHTEDWAFAHHGSVKQPRLGGGDPKFFSSPRLRALPDPGPVAFDPAWGLPESLVERMKAMAAELGY